MCPTDCHPAPKRCLGSGRVEPQLAVLIGRSSGDVNPWSGACLCFALNDTAVNPDTSCTSRGHVSSLWCATVQSETLFVDRYLQ